MRGLIAVDDVATRDVIVTAVASFSDVEVDVDAVDIESGRDLLRGRPYDFAVITWRSDSRESVALFEEVRELAKDLILVALTPKDALQGRRGERAQFDLFALLGTPLDPVDLYRTLRRIMDRRRRGSKV